MCNMGKRVNLFNGSEKYSWLTGSGGFVSSGGLRMLFIYLHMVDKVIVAILFAKHRFNFVVIFRKNYQQCSYKIYLQRV